VRSTALAPAASDVAMRRSVGCSRVGNTYEVHFRRGMIEVA
jgi:hypothetical protein